MHPLRDSHARRAQRPETSRRLALRSVVLAALLSMIAAALVGFGSVSATAAGGSAPVVRVEGNRLVDSSGAPFRMLGVNKSGTEFACAQGWGFIDGPGDQRQLDLMRSWGVNTVRVPLNQSCWLGTDGVSTTWGGQPYRAFISDWVARINASGMLVVLDLHWNDPKGLATGQQDMADARQSPAFWTSVATHFTANPSVVFDLYNEPHDISWSVWRDGGITRGGWMAAGYQQLVDAVRSTGARQPVIVNGMNWAGDLSQWLQYRPHDPLGQVIAGAHIYDFSQYHSVADWDRTIAPVAQQVPVYMSEFGDHTCGTTFNTGLMDWMDRTGVSWTAWTWNTWDCGSGPALIAAYDGTPTTSGAVVRDRLRALAPSTTSTITTVTTATATATAPSTTTVASPTPTSSSSSSTSATPTATASGSASPFTAYDFEGGIAPWVAEGSGITVQSSATAYTGTRSLAAQRSVVRNRTSVLRLNSGGRPLDITKGSRLAAWVRLDAGTKGTWRARLELQDVGWTWRAGASTTLVPGQWVRITMAPDATLWSGHRAVGVQVDGSGGTSSLSIRLDTLTQQP